MECPFCHGRTRTAKPCGKCGVFSTAKPAKRGQRAWTGVPKRPGLDRRPVFDDRTEEAMEAGIFANDRGVLAPVPFSPESYEDDPGGSYDNARRAREDGL